MFHLPFCSLLLLQTLYVMNWWKEIHGDEVEFVHLTGISWIYTIDMFQVWGGKKADYFCRWQKCVLSTRLLACGNANVPWGTVTAYEKAHTSFLGAAIMKALFTRCVEMEAYFKCFRTRWNTCASRRFIYACSRAPWGARGDVCIRAAPIPSFTFEN